MTQVIRFNRTQHLLGNINIQHTVTIQRTVLEGVPVILSLGQVLCRECAAVDDKQPAFNKIVQVGDQRGRIHSHQHVEFISGRSDVFSTEVNLEGGNPESCANWCSDFSRKIGKSGKIIAVQRGSLRKIGSGKLHAITRISGKAHHNIDKLLRVEVALWCLLISQFHQIIVPECTNKLHTTAVRDLAHMQRTRDSTRIFRKRP